MAYHGKKLNHKARRILVSAVLLLLAAGVGLVFTFYRPSAKPALPEGSIAVHFLDVGQGDSIFAELPDGKTMLIDAGERFYGRGVVTYIRRAGYDKIDYLVATHPHADHIGGMAYIIRHMDVGAFYMPAVTHNQYDFENLLNALRDKNLKIQRSVPGTRIFDTDACTVEIIAPQALDEENLNNSSLVLRVTHGQNRFLLTGDAELSEMEAIDGDLSADILKVGHHGSTNAFDARLLQRVKPRIAVISCGEDNPYGHPHNATMMLLQTAGCKVYRTDRDKTVVVTSDGKDVRVATGRDSIQTNSEDTW